MLPNPECHAVRKLSRGEEEDSCRLGPGRAFLVSLIGWRILLPAVAWTDIIGYDRRWWVFESVILIMPWHHIVVRGQADVRHVSRLEVLAEV